MVRLVPSLLIASLTACLWTAAAAPSYAASSATETYYGIVSGPSLATTGFARVVMGTGIGTMAIKIGSGPQLSLKLKVISGDYVGSSGNVSVDLKPTSLPNGAPGLSGTMAKGNPVIPLTLALTAAPSDAASLAGRYTLLLESSASVAGTGTLQILPSGALIFTGILSDGTIVSQGATLNASNGWSLLAQATNGAVLAGEITFADAAESDCSGSVSWKTPAPKKTVLPEQDTELTLVGSSYDPTLVWSAASSWTLSASIDGSNSANFVANLIANGSLLRFNQILLTPGSVLPGMATGPNASILIDVTSGNIAGYFVTASNAVHGLGGIVFQKTNSAYGTTSDFAGSAFGPGIKLVASSLRTSASTARQLPSLVQWNRGATAGSFSIEITKPSGGSNPGGGTPDGGTLTLTGGGDTSGGTLTLNGGYGSYTGGGLTVGGATLTLGNGVTAFGGGFSGGTLTLSGGAPTNGSVTITANPITDGTVNTIGTITLGSGTLALSNQPTEGITVSSGTLNLSGSSSGGFLYLSGVNTLGSGSLTLATVNSGAALHLAGSPSGTSNTTTPEVVVIAVTTMNSAATFINSLPATETISFEPDPSATSTCTGAQLQSALADAIAQGQTSFVYGGVTFNL